ncbi:uncharacterized protein LOC143917257 [Arctopsyche grandis]|uniref:uncharacterized protein LOC143917257 n=1 Tax=Arctopsyche grandis TaxID=121162 RepID=UPI00406D988C
MTPSENEAKNPLLCVNITSLALWGLLPFQNEKFLKNKRLRRLHFVLGFMTFMIFIIFVITQYIELFYVWGNIGKMTTIMTVSCLYTVTILKIYTLYGNRKKIYSLIEDVSKVEISIIKYQNSELQDILRGYIKMARRASYVFWTATVITALAFFTIPLLEYRLSSTYHRIYDNGTEYWSYVRPMVFSSWLPFDQYAYPNHMFVYIFHVAIGSIGGGFTSCWDMFVISMIVHSIGQLRILTRNLIEITKRDVELDEELCSKMMNDGKFKVTSKPEAIRKMWENIQHKRLVDCINHHRHIRRYTQMQKWN